VCPNALTVVIPTRNRPRYLARALGYYRETACPYPIVVCDSSTADLKPDVATAVRGGGQNVDLMNLDYGLPINDKLVRTVEAVRSKYMVFAADDDFIVPDTIGRCVTFLDSHDDYTVAHGRAFTFKVAGSNVTGPITSVRPYRQVASVLPTPRARLVAHFHDWSTSFYSVQRTQNVREILQSFGALQNDITACEVYFYATNVIRGKAAALDCNYMYRQVDVPKEHVSVDTHIWADSPGGRNVRDALVRQIAFELSRASHEPLDNCAALVASLLKQWVDGRRPYAFRRWRSYPPRYYWERTQNLGHKLGMRMREFRRPSPEGQMVRAIVEARA
jgi:glycosyltransferase domain-containing protein